MMLTKSLYPNEARLSFNKGWILTVKTLFFARRTMSSSNMNAQEDGTLTSNDDSNNAKSRRSIFRRKTKKVGIKVKFKKLCKKLKILDTDTLFYY